MEILIRSSFIPCVLFWATARLDLTPDRRPSLAYRAPEGDDEDLIGTDLNQEFYDYLSEFLDDQQVIIIENTDPPDNIKPMPNVQMFSNNRDLGRYGFFFPLFDANN